ncbi:hypothetical protein [Paenibacillus sp. J22TS3]|nr:hypothetical protein [Paenibacillus sp. J22TS3]
MDRNRVWSKLSQLPLALSGIVHEFADNGRSLSIFGNSINLLRCEMPLLP